MTDTVLPYRIHFEERPGYLYARVTGETDSIETSLAYWKEIAAECHLRNAKRVLVVEGFETSAPMMDVFAVAEELPSIVGGIIVAFVDERLDELEANQFGEDVAVNRGAFGKVFADQAAAVAWLTSSAK